MSAPTIPVAIDDPVNARILAVSEDGLHGFYPDPFAQISRLSGVDTPTVLERIRAMLAAGTIRRVRQTLMATNLAPGALVAWQVPPERLAAAFDFLFQHDPFSGHVVIRTTDAVTAATVANDPGAIANCQFPIADLGNGAVKPVAGRAPDDLSSNWQSEIGNWQSPAPGATYRLWTTLKVPQGFSLEKHCRLLAELTGAERFRIMPAKYLFALGVGHVRRRGLAPGARSEELAEAIDTKVIPLSDLDWRVLLPLKRELTVEEIGEEPWTGRAREAGLELGEFCRVAASLAERGVLGRFSTFLEHVKPLSGGQRVTRFNGLFHWAVPPGREMEAGRQIGRHHILTHAYWREGGPEFRGVNLMAVAHGLDKALLLRHKAAIDEHLRHEGIPVVYTNVFWGGRSEIKPSEIAPQIYSNWCRGLGRDPEMMRAEEM